MDKITSLDLERNSALWFLFEDLDDWEVNHWLPSTSVPQLIETFRLFQLVGINPVMLFCPTLLALTKWPPNFRMIFICYCVPADDF